MKLFSGSSNHPLALEVAKTLDIKLSKADVTRFDNSEVRVRIEEDVKDEVCVVLQATSNPSDTNLMELFFFCDALKRGEARKVIGFIPYFGYARQDVQHMEGESVSANVVIRFLEAIGFDKIYTVDLHNEATEGAFSVPFKNMTAMPLLAEDIRSYYKENEINLDPKEVAVLVPDQGAIEQGRNFGEMLFGSKEFSLAVVEKHRDLDTLNKVTSFGLYGDVMNKHVVIIDDMIVSGGTLMSAVDYLLDHHKCKSVIAAMTHHDFAQNAHKKLAESKLKAIFTTNTIQLKREQNFNILHESSIAELVAAELEYLT